MSNGQVIYLNRYLNCSDEELRRNYAYQDRMAEAKAKFWNDLRGVDRYQQYICYQRFIHANRDRMKLILSDQVS